MSLTISLSPEVEELLRRRAAAVGKDAATYAGEVVEEKLRAPRPFREILAPLQDAFASAPANEDDLNALFTELREEAWQERQQKATGSP